MSENHRRPIAARELKLSHRVASALAKAGLSANSISVMSAIFGIGAGLCFWSTGFSAPSGAQQSWLWIAGALLIFLRLLANMFDGMVAIATATSSAVGELYNELPDRISDSAILLGIGYAAGGSPTLGYLAALIAVGTAYVRAVGKGAGAHSDFSGPMAKQQRMAVLIALSLLMSFTPNLSLAGYGLPTWSLGLISALGALTIARRTVNIARALGKQALAKGENNG